MSETKKDRAAVIAEIMRIYDQLNAENKKRFVSMLFELHEQEQQAKDGERE